jgi:ubiquinone/menaquinone biosynthesis C-methylase UbiE
MFSSRFDSVRDEYGQIAADYDARWRGYIEATARRTLPYVEPAAGDAVLDVGCGTGVLLEMLARRTGAGLRVGLDFSPPMLARARERLGADAVLAAGDALALPFADASFEFVLTNSSLHYWPDAEAALDELVRVLRPGGRLVITDWCADYLTIRVLVWWLRARGRPLGRVFRAAELRTMLAERGLHVVTERYRIGRFWGMMTHVAARAVSRTGGHER